MIEFDVETTGLQWYAGDRMFLAQFYDGDTVEVLRHPGDEERIQEWLRRDDDYRAWNTKFDLHFLQQAGYDLPPPERWHDGMVLAHVMDERSSAALKFRAEAMFGAGERDPQAELHRWILDERKRRRKAAKDANEEYVPPDYSDVPDEVMRPYAEQDVLLTRRVCEVYERALRDDELASVYDLERGVLGALYDVECRGLPIDRDAAVAFERELLDQHDEILARCIRLAGIDTFNPGSSDQLAEALRRRGADLRFVTKGKNGKLKMDAENLSTVHDELAYAVQEYRSTAKLLNTYLRPMLHSSMGDYGPVAPFLGPHDRIHPNFRQVGARTARMSCSDPNVQNWHRDDLRLRHLVRATEGKVLVACDLDAIEMRLFAAFAGEGEMLRLIREGGDIHTNTADAVRLEDFHRPGGTVEPKRQRGKKFNYAVAYGMGVRGMRKWFLKPQKEARQMLDRFHAMYPEVGELQQTIAHKLADRGYVKTPWGRRHRIPVRDSYLGTAALVQGTAADLFKEAVIRCWKQGVPVITVNHDEIVAEVDRADAPEAAEIIREALVDHPRIAKAVPLDADAKIVDRWSWAKDPDYSPSYERT